MQMKTVWNDDTGLHWCFEEHGAFEICEKTTAGKWKNWEANKIPVTLGFTDSENQGFTETEVRDSQVNIFTPLLISIYFAIWSQTVTVTNHPGNTYYLVETQETKTNMSFDPSRQAAWKLVTERKHLSTCRKAKNKSKKKTKTKKPKSSHTTV